MSAINKVHCQETTLTQFDFFCFIVVSLIMLLPTSWGNSITGCSVFRGFWYTTITLNSKFPSVDNQSWFVFFWVKFFSFFCAPQVLHTVIWTFWLVLFTFSLFFSDITRFFDHDVHTTTWLLFWLAIRIFLKKLPDNQSCDANILFLQFTSLCSLTVCVFIFLLWLHQLFWSDKQYCIVSAFVLFILHMYNSWKCCFWNTLCNVLAHFQFFFSVLYSHRIYLRCTYTTFKNFNQ